MISKKTFTAPEAPTTPAPAPVAQVNNELAKKVEALEAKVEDLIARLSRKMTF